MGIAVQIQHTGRPPAVVDREDPEPGDGEVGVRLLAAPITPLDLLCASGTSYFGAPSTPYVPGVQGVGVAGGQLVWFPTSAGMTAGDGSMATVVAVRRDCLVPLPARTSPTVLAALGLSAVAAEMALTRRGEFAAGEQVIVLGAGGVVGEVAIQLARLAGARRVIAGARSAAACARAESAGADEVVVLDTDDVDELASRFAAAADGPVDLLLDPIFGPAAAASATVLGHAGRRVNLGGSASETCPVTSSMLRSRSLRLLGYTNNELSADARAAAITKIADLALRGSLRVTHETVPLADATAAWQRQATGSANGRIVLVPDLST